MPTNTNTSLKGLRACKEALDILIRGTADLKFSLDVIRTASADNGIEIDSEAMEECGQMLSTCRARKRKGECVLIPVVKPHPIIFNVSNAVYLIASYPDSISSHRFPAILIYYIIM